MENKIKSLFLSRDYAEIVRIASDMDVNEAATLFSQFDEEDLVQVLSLFDDEKLGEFLPEFDKDTQNLVVTRLNQKKLQSVMDEISVDDTIGIIDNLPAPVASKVVEVDEIKNLLEKKRYKSLKELLSNINAIDIAAVFEELDEQERVLTFRLLTKDAAAEVFVELASDVQQELIRNLSDKELKSVIDEIFIDDAVDLIEEMPASVVKRLLAQSDAETRNYINELLKYPQNSTGSIMTVELVSLSKTMTVKQAFERIRACAIDKETVYTCYVTDETKHLIGVTTVRELLLADANAQIGDIMHENVIYAHTLDDREDTARRLREYGFLALPVVDDEMRLVGIVTIDDAIDVMVDETTEDISKIAATRPSDKPYLKTSVWTIFKKPHTVAFDSYGQCNVYGAYHQQIRSKTQRNQHRAYSVCAYAYGYGRQRRFASVGHGNTCSCAQRSEDQRHFQSALEGDTSRDSSCALSCDCVFCQVATHR